MLPSCPGRRFGNRSAPLEDDSRYVCGVLRLARDDRQHNPNTFPKQRSCHMEMPKPNEAHKQMSRLAGTWIGEEIMHPSQWDPAGGTATGRIENRIGLDGFALIWDYEQRRGEVVTFRGHSVWTFDARAGEYALYWFDSMGMPPDVFRGKLDGDKLTLVSHGPMGYFRLTYHLVGEGQLRNRMEVSQDGQQWATLFEGSYTRQR